MGEVDFERVYDDPGPDDGTRVLIDRLWPRGLSKDKAQVDEWLKEIAPTTELRKWFGHDPERYDEFATRYEDELTEPAHVEALDRLTELAGQGKVTLLTATKDLQLSHGQVLLGLLR